MDIYVLSTLGITLMILKGNELQIFLKLFLGRTENSEVQGSEETTEGNIGIHVHLISI